MSRVFSFIERRGVLCRTNYNVRAAGPVAQLLHTSDIAAIINVRSTRITTRTCATLPSGNGTVKSGGSYALNIYVSIRYVSCANAMDGSLQLSMYIILNLLGTHVIITLRILCLYVTHIIRRSIYGIGEKLITSTIPV